MLNFILIRGLFLYRDVKVYPEKTSQNFHFYIEFYRKPGIRGKNLPPDVYPIRCFISEKTSIFFLKTSYYIEGQKPPDVFQSLVSNLSKNTK